MVHLSSLHVASPKRLASVLSPLTAKQLHLLSYTFAGEFLAMCALLSIA